MQASLLAVGCQLVHRAAGRAAAVADQASKRIGAISAALETIERRPLPIRGNLENRPRDVRAPVVRGAVEVTGRVGRERGDRKGAVVAIERMQDFSVARTRDLE